MRLVVGVAGLAVALTTTASAQAPAPSWRSAAKAALAFGHAEGEMAALRRFTIKAAPQTKQAADAVLAELNRHAQRAREAYIAVERYGSPTWSAAAKIRIGDAFLCQADKISAIPPPQQLTAGLPPGLLEAYLEVLQGLSDPLRDQATRQWERAAATEDASGWVIRRARERLAGTSLPDC